MKLPNHFIQKHRVSAYLGAILLTLTAVSAVYPSTHQSGLYSQGNEFLFGMYSLADPYLQNATKDGLTVIGPYYGPTAQQKTLKASRAAQLPSLYPAGRKLDFESPMDISIDSELENLRNNIAVASEQSNIAAWVLPNEELRYWNAKEMEWLQKATRTIRESDPFNRPIMMYEANHRKKNELIKTTQFLDFVVKGSYANFIGMKNKRTWIRWSTEQAVAASRVTNTIPLAVLWMSKDQDNSADISSIALWTRHDVYLSLISGAKGILIYSGWHLRAGFKNHFQYFYDGYVEAARQLTGELNLGEVFLNGKKKNSVSAEVINGVHKQTFLFSGIAHEYPTISIAEYTLGDWNYLFLINSAESEVTIKLNGLPIKSTKYYNAFDKKPVADALMGTLELERLEVLGFTWRNF